MKLSISLKLRNSADKRDVFNKKLWTYYDNKRLISIEYLETAVNRRFCSINQEFKKF